MPKVGFNDAYKEWRNQARRYDPESIVREAIKQLSQPAADALEDLRRAPWQVMLAVKWVCQDKAPNTSRRKITPGEFLELRQKLWEFPEHLDHTRRDALPLHLFIRQILRGQIGFQRAISSSFVREAALLAEQEESHPLKVLFETKIECGVCDFIDLSLGTFAAISEGSRRIAYRYFGSLEKGYSKAAIRSYIACISRSYSELVEFCRSLSHSNTKVASEFYEFPVLTRYPFLRTGEFLECWHPAIFYRGLEGFVHSVLSEEGQAYMDRFSKLFERHVTSEARKAWSKFLDEDDLRQFVHSEDQIPDGLLSFPTCNIFIESKAGLFDESVMTVGHNEMFARKTRALQKAVKQTWSASSSLRIEGRAPSEVLNAQRDFLMIVTNRELSASRGTTLASMYPPGTLDYPNANAEKFLPLDRIYVLSIEDFERLMRAVADESIDLPTFLDSCVSDDSEPDTALHYFEQHLDRRRVSRRFSDLVHSAIDHSTERLQEALELGESR